MSHHCARPTQPIRNQRGQGLIEYLIIVALMGVATIAIMRIMGETVSNRFANITNALQGEKSTKAPTRVVEKDLKQRDLGTFMKGAAAKESGQSKGDD